MGTDWVKAKVNKKDDISTIKTWIQRQARNFPRNALQEAERQLLFSTSHKMEEQTSDSMKIYCEASQQLTTFLTFPNSSDKQPYVRIAVITSNQLLPIEWKLEAYRTILPEELPVLLHTWKTYLHDIRKGAFQNYIHELFLYHDMLECRRSVEMLKSHISTSFTLDNAWAKKKIFLQIRDNIIQQGIPALSPYPLPAFDKRTHAKAVTTVTLQTYHRYREKKYLINEYIRQWNRCVASKWKIPHLPDVTIEECKNHFINNTCLLKFFEWCEILIEEKYGLYLDY